MYKIKIIFFCSFMILGMAKPFKSIKLTYQYRSSNSEYLNNELQHQSQDQVYYSNAENPNGQPKNYHKHFEYTNPKLKQIGNIETKPYARQDNGNGYSDNNRYGGHFASQGSNSGYGLSGGQPIKNNGQVYAQW